MLERVAHFTILEKLGQGGMGIVFKAQDTKLRRLVALKLLPPEHVGDAERRARFMREARAAAAVTHPNIATVYEIGEDEAGRIYIAMELAAGRSLREELVARAPLGVAETLAVARQVVRGLAKAHDVGLVHRDLKPDNLMLGPEGEVKILDFGLAKARELATPSILAAAVTGEIGAVTDAGVIVGTPGYMSPEQATGGDVDARSDLFALGVVIFEMLTGKLPFRGNTVGELIAAIVRDEPRSLAELAPDAPAPLGALLARCLAKSRDERPRDARAVLSELDAVEHRTPDVAFAATERIAVSDPPPAAPKQPRRRVVRILAAIVAFGIAGGALTLVSRTRPPPVAAVPDAGIGILDLPPPENCNDAARVEFRAALEETRGVGIPYGREGFERAIKADPTCAAAYLRASIASPGTTIAREHFNHASLLRARLSERDLALLDVYAPFYAQEPPAYRLSEDRMLALSRSRPRDADLLVQLGEFLWVNDPMNELATVAQRAIDIDPGYGGAWLLLGIARMKAGDEDGAQEAFDRCEDAIPTAVDCVQEGTRHAQWIGRCNAMEAHARTLAVRTPGEKNAAYEFLASALASNGADREAVAEALQQSTKSIEPDHVYLVEQDQARLAVAYGDFDRAMTLLASVEQRLKGSQSRPAHAAVAQARFELDLEMDRTDAALAVAEEFAARQSAWEGGLYEFYGSGDDGFLLVPRMLAVQAATGKITAARRDADIAAWVAHNETVGDARVRWIAQYATWVETPADAARALAAMPVTDAAAPRTAPLRGYSSAIAGRVLALGGRTAEGIAELQRFTRRCERLDYPIVQTQAYLWLGDALASTGALADACNAYGVVVARWNRARASKSAKRAVAQMKALKCGP